MGRRLSIKPGDRYSRLTIIKEVGIKNGHRHFLCRCNCGNEKIIDISRLRNGHTKSCGCFSLESTIKRSTKHGLYYHPLYGVWRSAKNRCINPNTAPFHRYGGRGIKICDEWANSFQSFYDWAIENGYENGLTLDRIDNDGNYEPSNCRWTTMRKQSNNRRNNHFITYKNKTLTLAEWGRRKNINETVILKRLKRGWSVEKTLTTPLLKNQYSRCSNDS